MRPVAFALLPLVFALPALGTETETRLPKGISATLTMPGGEGPFPAVLMLHGLGSTRNEVGNLFADAAQALADRGIASLRFDYRGFGRSDGDTGDFTLDRQNEDSLIALAALIKAEGVDPARIGVLGFSFGGGAAIELAAAEPDTVRSLVTWTPVGIYAADMLDSMGQKVFDRAAEDGIVGLDLGWQTITLRQHFFDSLYAHDLPAALAAWPGPFLTINGDDDPYGKYADGLIAAAVGTDKQALVMKNSDHIFHVYTPSRSTAAEVVRITAERFAKTLGRGE